MKKETAKSGLAQSRKDAKEKQKDLSVKESFSWRLCGFARGMPLLFRLCARTASSLLFAALREPALLQAG
jgi:hypothetical protein